MSSPPHRRSGRTFTKRSYTFFDLDDNETLSESEMEWEPPEGSDDDDSVDDEDLQYKVPDEDPLALRDLNEDVLIARTGESTDGVGSNGVQIKVFVLRKDKAGREESTGGSLGATTSVSDQDDMKLKSETQEANDDIKNDSFLEIHGTAPQTDTPTNVSDLGSTSKVVTDEERRKQKKRDADKLRYSKMTKEQRAQKLERSRLNRRRKKQKNVAGGAEGNFTKSSNTSKCIRDKEEQRTRSKRPLTDEQRQKIRERARARAKDKPSTQEERDRRAERQRLRRMKLKLAAESDNDDDDCNDSDTEQEAESDKCDGQVNEEVLRKRSRKNMTKEQRDLMRKHDRIRYIEKTKEKRRRKLEQERERRLKMTDEERAQDDEAIFQRRMQDYLYRHAKLATMTEEEKKKYQREITIGRYVKHVLNETPEERQERLIRQREKYRLKRLNMTPEQQHHFRSRARKNTEKYSKVKKYNEMSEEEKERHKAYQRERMKNETPEQREKRLARYKRNMEKKRMLLKMQEEGLSKEEAEKELRISRPDLYLDPNLRVHKKGKTVLPPGAPYQYQPRGSAYKSTPGRKPSVRKEELEAYFAEKERKLQKQYSRDSRKEDVNATFNDEAVTTTTTTSTVSVASKLPEMTELETCSTATTATTTLTMSEPSVFVEEGYLKSHEDNSKESENLGKIFESASQVRSELVTTDTDSQNATFVILNEDENSNSLEAVVDDSSVASPFGADYFHDDEDEDSLSLVAKEEHCDVDKFAKDVEIEINRSSDKKQVRPQENVKKITLDTKFVESSDLWLKDENGNYYCEICAKIYKTRKHFKVHMESQHANENKVFQCPYKDCDKQFRHSAYVLTHFHQVHGTGSDFRLRKNATTDKSKSEVEATVCPYCGNDFFNTASMTRHISNVHEYIPDKDAGFMCQYCSKVYKNKDYLEDHTRRIHLGMENKCDLCGRSFQSPVKLWRHKVDAHYMTDLDPSSVSSKLNVVQCEYCGVKLFRRMKEHIEKEHPEHLEEYKSQQISKSYSSWTPERRRECQRMYEKKRKEKNPPICHHCNKTFTRLYNYRLHMEKMHKLPLQDVDGKNLFSCAKCQKICINEKHLVNHILSKHAKLSKIKILGIVDDEDEGRELRCCQFCRTPQENRQLYRVHLLDKHMQNILSNFNKSIDTYNARVSLGRSSSYSCPYCDRVMKTSSGGIILHICQKHPGQSYDMFLKKRVKPIVKAARPRRALRKRKGNRKKAELKTVKSEEEEECEDDMDTINALPTRKSSRVRGPSRRYIEEEASDKDEGNLLKRPKRTFEKLFVPTTLVELTPEDKKLLAQHQDISWNIPIVKLERLRDEELLSYSRK